MKMKSSVKKFLIISSVMVGGYFAVTQGIQRGLIPMPQVMPSAVPPKIDLPNMPIPSPLSPYVNSPIPIAKGVSSATLPNAKIPEIRLEGWEWNAQFPIFLANGGPCTTPESLMAKNGVKLCFNRQDDTNVMVEHLITFAQELAGGNPHPKGGVHFVVIMGDQMADFSQKILPQMLKWCQDCAVKVIGAVGFSYGEDKVYGPQAWKDNPQLARGGTILTPIREGDWNIGQKWIADNDLCTNPDTTTHDPDCVNWIHTDSNIAAAEAYVAGTCYDLKEIKKGRLTGKTVRICPEAAAVWTPSDVTAAMQRGGGVSIVSTKEYVWQMPAIVIGSDRWMKANRYLVEGMLDAFLKAGDLVKADPQAKHRAAEISAQAYNDQDAAYWETYFDGVTQPDKQGQMVELGGSRAIGLQDNLQLFGLLPGGDNIYAKVYTGFGNIVVSQYPKLVPNFPPVETILDLSYLKNVAARTQAATPATMPTYNAYKPIQEKISKKSWEISFDTGKATLTSDGEHVMQEIYDSAVQTGLKIQVDGHTDNTGNRERNLNLSEARAFTVKQWLQKQSPINFPNGRVNAIGHGSDFPIAPNDSEEHKRQNRRVEITMGS